MPDDPPAEVPLDFAREWVEFADPADPDHRIRADLTWLTSAWTCIFGRGCAGVVEGRPDDGCCSHGAFFTDEDDLARVTAAVGAADRRRLAARRRSAATSWTEEDAADDDRGRASGRCAPARSTAPASSSTGPGYPGGTGCALHRMALRTGVHPLTTKPDVCWQLPVRREQEHVERPDGTTGAGDDASASSTGAAGARAGTTCTGGAPARRPRTSRPSRWWTPTAPS